MASINHLTYLTHKNLQINPIGSGLHEPFDLPLRRKSLDQCDSQWPASTIRLISQTKVSRLI